MGGVSVLVPPRSFGLSLRGREGGGEGGRGREREGLIHFSSKTLTKLQTLRRPLLHSLHFLHFRSPALPRLLRAPPPSSSLVPSFSHRLDPLPLDKLTARRAGVQEKRLITYCRHPPSCRRPLRNQLLPMTPSLVKRTSSSTVPAPLVSRSFFLLNYERACNSSGGVPTFPGTCPWLDGGAVEIGRRGESGQGRRSGLLAPSPLEDHRGAENKKTRAINIATRFFARFDGSTVRP